MAQRTTEQPDFLIRGTLDDPALRFAFAGVTDTVNTGILVHDTDPVAASLFGRCLTGAVLLSPLLTEGEKFMIRWEYPDGKIGSLLVDVDDTAQVRGISKERHPMKSVKTERDLYGTTGQVTVLQSANGVVSNSGTATAQLLDVVDDLGFFFSTSFQLETEMVIGLDFRPDPTDPVDAAAGFLLQAMPGCDLSAFSVLRERIRGGTFRETLLRRGISWEFRLRELLSVLVPGLPINMIEGEPPNLRMTAGPRPSYTCNCDEEKMIQAVKLLDPLELDAIFESRRKPEITCEFCNSVYAFSKKDLGIID